MISQVVFSVMNVPSIAIMLMSVSTVKEKGKVIQATWKNSDDSEPRDLMITNNFIAFTVSIVWFFLREYFRNSRFRWWRIQVKGEWVHLNCIQQAVWSITDSEYAKYWAKKEYQIVSDESRSGDQIGFGNQEEQGAWGV